MCYLELDLKIGINFNFQTKTKAINFFKINRLGIRFLVPFICGIETKKRFFFSFLKPESKVFHKSK